MADSPVPPREDQDRHRLLDRIAREQPPAPPEAELYVEPGRGAAQPTRGRPHENPPLDENPLLTLVCAGLFLYVGFFVYDLEATYKSPYRGETVLAFAWMARIVGFGLLACAVLAWMGQRIVLPLNFGLALLAAAGCLVCGALFLMFGWSQDGFLTILFGLLNASAARGAWMAWRGRRENAG